LEIVKKRSSYAKRLSVTIDTLIFKPTRIVGDSSPADSRKVAVRFLSKTQCRICGTKAYNFLVKLLPCRQLQ